MTKINEDCHIVNQPKGLDAYAMPKPYPTMEQVEASRDPYHAPTYTREELVEIALRGCGHNLSGNTVYRADMRRALNALIALGVVRVKSTE